MIDYDSYNFQKVDFSTDQISQYINSAERDLEIAWNSDVPEVIFKFSYDSLIKIGIAVIAKQGFKVRSQVGHHIKIIEKLSQIINDENIIIVGNKMRQERNVDLYNGGSSISEKASLEYRSFVGSVLKQAKENLSQ